MISRITTLETQLANTTAERRKIDLLNILAWELRYIDPNRALKLSREAYQRSQSSSFSPKSYIKGFAHSLRTLSFINIETTQYSTALQELLDGLAILEQEDAEHRIILLNTLGVLYRAINNFAESLTVHLDALHLAEQIDDSEGQADAYHGIGNIYYDLGHHEQSLEASYKFLNIYRKLGDKFKTALALNNLGIAYLNLEQYEKAFEYAHQSIVLFQKIDHTFGIAIATDSLGEIYLATNEPSKALTCFEQALALVRDNQHYKRAYVIYTLHLAQAYNCLYQPEQALSVLRDALDIATKLNLIKFQFQCHYELSTAFEQQGKMQTALDHFKQFYRLRQTVFDEQSAQKMKAAEVLYRTRQVEADAETQRQLRQQDRLYFEQLRKMQEDFISATSHDLRNPLSIILNYVYLLNTHGTTRDEKGQIYITKIEQKIEQMGILIRDLLDLAKLETGRSLNLELRSLLHFIQDTVDDFETIAQQNSLVLKYTPPDIELNVRFDPNQLRRVFDNLLFNAMKFTPVGGVIHLSIEILATEVHIHVTDTGMGISERDTDHIFDRFYQIQNSDQIEQSGVGLGLTIAKSIIEHHQGRIWVTSKVGEGSTFSFSLPLPQHQT